MRAEGSAVEPNPLAKKLGMKPVVRALIVASPAGYLERLAPLPDGASVVSAVSGKHQFVQVFARRLDEVREAMPKLLPSAEDGAMVWVAYPKKSSGMSSDLSRGAVCAEVVKLGWLPVSIVALDEVWSALRFRPEEDVKSKRVRPKL